MSSGTDVGKWYWCTLEIYKTIEVRDVKHSILKNFVTRNPKHHHEMSIQIHYILLGQ